MRRWLSRAGQGLKRFVVGLQLDRVDLFMASGLAALFIGAALVDMTGALLLVGALLVMIGIWSKP